MVSTPKGDLKFMVPNAHQLQAAALAWPPGIMQMGDENKFGLVFQHGEQEVWGVKFQQVDRCEEEAFAMFGYNHHRIAVAAASISGKHEHVSMIVGSYVRPRDAPESVEVGIVVFPMFLGPEVPQDEEKQGHPYFETAFPGCGKIIEEFMYAIPPMEGDGFIDFNIRPRNHMPIISLDFLITGEHLIFLEDVIEEEDPRWEILAEAGHDLVYHVPSIPMAVPEPVADGPR